MYTVLMGVFNLYREHLSLLCMLGYGGFLANRVGRVASVFGRFCCHRNLDVRHLYLSVCICIGRVYHSQGANSSLVVVYGFIGRMPLIWDVTVYC
jgi:hypothetical protein